MFAQRPMDLLALQNRLDTDARDRRFQTGNSYILESIWSLVGRDV